MGHGHKPFPPTKANADRPDQNAVDRPLGGHGWGGDAGEEAGDPVAAADGGMLAQLEGIEFHHHSEAAIREQSNIRKWRG